MDTQAVTNLLAYSAQTACIAALGALVAVTLRLDAAAIRYAYWRALLLLCLILPWVQGRVVPAAWSPTVDAAARADFGSTPGASPVIASMTTSIDWFALVPVVLIAGAVARLAWLTTGLVRLRRLRHAGEVAECDGHVALQRIIGARAEVRYVSSLDQPVTFGVVAPVVLLPASLRGRPREVQEAVLAHELFHVRRRDWAWMLAEEVARAVFWFHPGMWWLISRVQLAREEVVDELAVLATGRRRVYVEALLAFAEANPLAAAPAFVRRRHLFRRMMLVSKEAVMSPARIVVTVAVMACVVVLGGWYAVAAFPLQAPQGGSVGRDLAVRSTPGPIEQAARPITPENPIPRRILSAPPAPPDEAGDISANVSLVITIDANGRVVEARPTAVTVRWADRQMSATFSGPDVGSRVLQLPSGLPSEMAATFRRVILQLVESAVASTGQWLYDTPVDGPLAFPATVVFGDNPVASLASFTVNGTPAVRVGKGIAPPRQVTRVRPVYPAAARAAGVSGVVIIELLIDEAGRVVDTRLLRSIPILDQSALDAVRQWVYTPTLLNGAPVPVLLTVTVNFTQLQ